MPSAHFAGSPGAANSSAAGQRGLLRLTNCSALLPDGSLAHDYTLLIDRDTGRIVDGQSEFYHNGRTYAETVDLKGNLLVPGYIDAQINGAYGIDFGHFDESLSTEDAQRRYTEGMDRFAARILETGVTSFVPTVITQKPELYRKILPVLAPRSKPVHAHSLGFHVEGPFISPCKKGMHSDLLIRSAANGIADLEDIYGSGPSGLDMRGVKIVTVAPEIEGVLAAIAELRKRGCTISIGHTNSDIDTAVEAHDAGASLITHLFNAMSAFNHRDPGVVGLLGRSDPPGSKTADGHAQNGKQREESRPYYGMIVDGYHCHPYSVRMAYSCHPSGCVLTSDAVPWMDPSKPDGTYPWREGQNVSKVGFKVVLEGTDTLAGSTVPLSECVKRLSEYASIPLHEAAACATIHPAKMLGIQDRKGLLQPGNDADLTVLDARTGDVVETWIMGVRAWSRGEGAEQKV